MFVDLLPSDKKKYKMIFYDDNRKKIKTVHFGQKGALDFTRHKKEDRDARKKAYIIRHEKRENWSDPMTAGALSRWILWSKPTIEGSFRDYKKRFNLKKYFVYKRKKVP